MRISRSGRSGDDFGEALEKMADKIPGSDKLHEQRLREHRETKGQEHKIGTEESLLDVDRKNDSDTTGQQLIEKNLHEEAGSESVEQITEAQLGDSEGKYPHRNSQAYERTGDKRPINALDEEMGDAGDASKLERYEKASVSDQPKRILDDDVGKQLTNEKTTIKNAYNLNKHKSCSAKQAVGNYLSYKDGASFNRKFAEVRKLDDAMLAIAQNAQEEGRVLNGEETSKIEGLKRRKVELLKITDEK